MAIAIMDVATTFLQSDKFKKDKIPPPLVSDGGDDEFDDETFNRKEGFDDNLTSHDRRSPLRKCIKQLW
jgi:hypothetical protein